MTKQEKRLAELKPQFNKLKERVEILNKNYEIAKSGLNKMNTSIAGKDANFKNQLRNESSAQSMLFGAVPSSKHLNERVSSLRAQRNTSNSMAAALKKTRSRYMMMSKRFDKVSQYVMEERKLFEEVSNEIKKIETQMSLSLERRKKRQMSRQQKKQA